MAGIGSDRRTDRYKAETACGGSSATDYAVRRAYRKRLGGCAYGCRRRGATVYGRIAGNGNVCDPKANRNVTDLHKLCLSDDRKYCDGNSASLADAWFLRWFSL